MESRMETPITDPCDGSFQTRIIDLDEIEWLLGEARHFKPVFLRVSRHQEPFIAAYVKLIPPSKLLEIGKRYNTFGFTI
ncbi:hypothetical protein NXS19_007582 [Fusarium pseudograminearum]|nr:hypothetical protein NXS19_007582 [Fusarium pseudograminearum]